MYRLEIDALNALVAAQNRTNELLEKILERGLENELHSNSEEQYDNSAGNKRDIHGGIVQDRTVQPSKGNGKRGSRGNAEL